VVVDADLAGARPSGHVNATAPVAPIGMPMAVIVAREPLVCASRRVEPMEFTGSGHPWEGSTLELLVGECKGILVNGGFLVRRAGRYLTGP
jgi:hypothetical protein